MKIAVASFTQNGKKVEQDLQAFAKGDFTLYDKNQQSLKEFVCQSFQEEQALIFVGATGIGVRMIAPHIKSKDTDIAVVVIDELARFVVPLLSGHIGGANELALGLANLLGAVPVITTATDINGVFAVDTWCYGCGCVIADIGTIKHISSALLQGKNVGFCSDFPLLGKLESGLVEDLSMENGIAITLDDTIKPFFHTLHVIPKIITLGVGCKKDIPAEEFEDFMLQTLKTQNISLLAVCKIGSIDLKKEEKCILEFAKKYNIPFETYTGEELSQVEGSFTASQFVNSITGVDCVCERSAMMGADTLILKKTVQSGKTIAIARKEWKCKF